MVKNQENVSVRFSNNLPQKFDEPQKTTTTTLMSARISVLFSCWLCLPQLFTKRYYKTKHGTYVPTLREYWKPGTAQKDLLSVGSKRRWWDGLFLPARFSDGDTVARILNYGHLFLNIWCWIKIMFLENRQPDNSCYFYAFEILIKLFSVSVIFCVKGIYSLHVSYWRPPRKIIKK